MSSLHQSVSSKGKDSLLVNAANSHKITDHQKLLRQINLKQFSLGYVNMHKCKYILPGNLWPYGS